MKLTEPQIIEKYRLSLLPKLAREAIIAIIKKTLQKDGYHGTIRIRFVEDKIVEYEIERKYR